MNLKNVEEESILFLFSHNRKDMNFDSYSSIIMKYNYRDVYNSINFKIEIDNAYIINEPLEGKKIILGVDSGYAMFAFDLYDQLKSHGIQSVLIPVLSEDYFEDDESKKDIKEIRLILEHIKKILTILSEHDKINLEVKIKEVEKENENE